ncbi:MAG: DNA-directed RNA polymerase subunit omega [Sumerlaeia bacterium]
MAEKSTVPEFIAGGDGKYLTIRVLARRAKELGRTRPLVPHQDDYDPVEAAKDELMAGKLIIRHRNQITNELEDFEAAD